MKLTITRGFAVVSNREITGTQATLVGLVLDSDVSPSRLAWLLDGDNTETQCAGLSGECPNPPIANGYCRVHQEVYS